MKILIIEDEKQVADYIAKGLKEQGHITDIAHDGKEGLVLATTENYDCIVLDRMLPSIDGIQILKTLRNSDNKTPIIILSTLGDIDERVKGLNAGGDDYLTKPFAFSELLARIESLVRRNSNQTDIEQTKIKIKNIEINLLTRKATIAGKEIELLDKEFKLLDYLIKHKGQIVTRTMILESVWQYHFDPQTNVIDVHISRLRKKINDETGKIIRTIRGAGYIIE